MTASALGAQSVIMMPQGLGSLPAYEYTHSPGQENWWSRARRWVSRHKALTCLGIAGVAGAVVGGVVLSNESARNSVVTEIERFAGRLGPRRQGEFLQQVAEMDAQGNLVYDNFVEAYNNLTLDQIAEMGWERTSAPSEEVFESLVNAYGQNPHAAFMPAEGVTIAHYRVPEPTIINGEELLGSFRQYMGQNEHVFRNIHDYYGEFSNYVSRLARQNPELLANMGISPNLSFEEFVGLINEHGSGIMNQFGSISPEAVNSFNTALRNAAGENGSIMYGDLQESIVRLADNPNSPLTRTTLQNLGFSVPDQGAFILSPEETNQLLSIYGDSALGISVVVPNVPSTSSQFLSGLLDQAGGDISRVGYDQVRQSYNYYLRNGISPEILAQNLGLTSEVMASEAAFNTWRAENLNSILSARGM